MKANRRPQVGLSDQMILLFASLAIPRAVLHDLRLAESALFLNGLLALAPVVLWVGYVVYKKVRKPFQTLLVTGVVYGVLLGITDQLLWSSVWAGQPHQGFVFGLVARVSAFLSSVTTGVLTGLFLGTLAFFLQQMRLTESRRP